MLGKTFWLGAIMAAVTFGAVQADPGRVAVPPDAAEQSRILEAFRATVFGPENRQSKRRLFKWQKPIRVRLVGRAPESFRNWARVEAARLSGLTGLGFDVVDDIAADLLIYFVPRFSDVTDGDYNAIFRRYVPENVDLNAILEGFRATDAICGGQVVAHGRTLDEAIVFVPVSEPSQVVHSCIAAQMTRVLGLLFAPPDPDSSVLGVESPHSYLTELDKTLIRLLYAPELEPGMAVDAALEAAAKALPGVLNISRD